MNNSKIHYQYAISYLVVAIILLLALRYYEVPGLVDKLSFALTLSSLLLALLAIFYTIVSAHKQDNQFSKIIETNSDLKAAAKEIKMVSENINTALEGFPSHFKQMGLKIDDLADRYASQSPEKRSSKDKEGEGLNIDKNTFFEIVGNMQFTAMAVLYLFSQSSRKGKSIELSSFNSLGISTSDYAVGFLTGFEATRLIDFKIFKNTVIPVRCAEVIYKHLKPGLEAMINVIGEEQGNTLKARMEQTDVFVT